MQIKFLIDEDIANYYKTSMFIGFPHCTFKCERECGGHFCQNSKLALDPVINIETKEIISRYIGNPLTNALVIGGLEPFDDFDELIELVAGLRKYSDDDIVIYTGYYEDEISDKIMMLAQYKNIVIKFGRFVPDQESHYDEVLGVNLASMNQYAKRI